MSEAKPSGWVSNSDDGVWFMLTTHEYPDPVSVRGKREGDVFTSDPFTEQLTVEWVSVVDEYGVYGGHSIRGGVVILPGGRLILEPPAGGWVPAQTEGGTA